MEKGSFVYNRRNYSGSGSGGGGFDNNYGTTAEFEAIKDSLPDGSSFDITDDYSEGSGSSAKIAYGTTEEFNAQKESAEVGTTFLVTDDILDNSLLKTKTINVTTTSGGNFDTEIPKSNNIISITCDGNGCFVLPYYNTESTWYAHVRDVSNTVKGNLTINVKVVYI